jgi:hypothetical protein
LAATAATAAVTGLVARHVERQAPDVPRGLDCDSLHLPDADQTVIVYSAEHGSREAESLTLLRVIGTEQMTTSR